MKEFGVDDVVNTDSTDLSSLAPFDLTLDLVGVDPLLPVKVTKPGGRIVGLRTLPDQQAAAAKGVTAILQGTEITTQRLNRFRDYVEQGVLAPYVAQTFALSDISGAFRIKEAGGVPGKIAVALRRPDSTDHAANS
jgi:NADPH:quinone reductase-like Zn-dependent oxidoreductase